MSWRQPRPRRERRVRVVDFSSESSDYTSSSSEWTSDTASSSTASLDAGGALLVPRRNTRFARGARRGRAYPRVRTWSPIGDPAAHLCSLTLRDRAGPLARRRYVDVSNPGGEAKHSESCLNLLDTFPHTRWCDAAMAPVVLTLDAPATLTSFSLTTAYCDPSKDPVMWLLEGASDTEHPEWHVLHAQEAVSRTLALERSTEAGPVPLDMRMPVRVVRFTVLRVRGTVEEWAAAVRDLSTQRREAIRMRREGAAQQADSVSPARQAESDDETAECTFTPQINRGYGPKRSSSRQARRQHLQEMSEKGAQKLMTRRVAEARQRRPRRTAAARSHTHSHVTPPRSAKLYEEASERRDRQAERKRVAEASVKKESVSRGRSASKHTFEELYADARERHEIQNTPTSCRRSRCTSRTPQSIPTPHATRRRLYANRTP